MWFSYFLCLVTLNITVITFQNIITAGPSPSLMASWKLYYSRPINISSLVYKLMSSVGNGPLACKLKYVRNVGDVTSGGRSATILYTDKTGVLFVGYSRVPESCSLPRVCEQGVRVLTLRLAFETSESTVARVNTKKVARRHLYRMWQQAIAPPQCFLSSLFERPK